MKALDKEKERKKKAHSNLRFQGSYLKYHQHVLLLEKKKKERTVVKLSWGKSTHSTSKTAKKNVNKLIIGTKNFFFRSR